MSDEASKLTSASSVVPECQQRHRFPPAPTHTSGARRRMQVCFHSSSVGLLGKPGGLAMPSSLWFWLRMSWHRADAPCKASERSFPCPPPHPLQFSCRPQPVRRTEVMPHPASRGHSCEKSAKKCACSRDVFNSFVKQ